MLNGSKRKRTAACRDRDFLSDGCLLVTAEIELGDGRRVRVDRDVDGDALRRVIEALAPR